MRSIPALILDLCPASALAQRVREALNRLRPVIALSLGGDLASPTSATFGCAAAEAVRNHQPEVLVPCFPATARSQAEQFFTVARAECWDLPVLVATQERNAEELRALLSLGAADFVTEPFEAADLEVRLERLRPPQGNRESVIHQLKAKLGMRHFVGESPRLLAELRKIPAVARCGASVLIVGETGTGKELCARAIHHLSLRAHRPFIALNCGAVPADLVENELFGHAQGAYTSAATSATGLVQESDGGSLFLDEIDCLPLISQVKLLRFLQEKEFRPVGSSKTVRADVRVLAASNSDLLAAVRFGRFRPDLYYRLNVVSFNLPPLRQRTEDIAELAHHFLGRFSGEHGKVMNGFTPAALLQLRQYDWPGNVRELENVVERAVIFAEDSQVRARDLLLPTAETVTEGESFRAMKAKAVEQFERACIRELLAAHGGNISAAARAAKKNRRAFWELIRKHHIVVPPGNCDQASPTGPGPSASPA